MIDFQLPSLTVPGFSGLNDQEGVFGLKATELSVCNNMVCKGGAARRRFGYTRRIATAQGSTRVTGLGGFRDIDLTRTFVMVTGGKLYEDVSGTWTERSSGTPFDTTAHATLATVGRNIVVCDQNANTPLIWNGSAAPSTLNVDITKANCVGSHRGFLFVGSPTVTGQLASASTREFSTVRHCDDPSRPTVFSAGKSDLNLTGQVLAIMSTGDSEGDVGLIFLDDAIWYARYSPSAAGVGAGTYTFDYQPLDPGTGIVGPKAVCRVPGRRIFFWGQGEQGTGPYMITEKPIMAPRYIGRRIETFLSGMDKTQLSGVEVFSVPGQNCVLFCVPYGSSQTTNNYGVYYNWVDDTFAIFKGSSQKAFAFASAVTVQDSDATFQTYAGDYAGLVYKMGVGFRDDGQAIESEMWTAWLGRAGVENAWLSMVLNMQLSNQKTIEAHYRMFAKRDEVLQSLTGGAAGDPIETSFAVGLSAIVGQTTGRLVGDIYGDPSEFIQFGILDSQDNVDLVIYGLQAFYERASSWAVAS